MKTVFVVLPLLMSFSIQAQGIKIIENKQATVQQNPGKPNPLWIVDGMKMPEDSVSKGKFLNIDPNDIERISVVKGDSALIRYGEAGKNGVIIVTTKKAKSKKSKEHR